MDYRSLPRISNSDLTEFKRFIFGEKHYKPVNAFAFGSTLHELILEPHKPIQVPDSVDMSLCTMLARAARNDCFLSWALRFSQKESVQLWNDPATGLALKARLDIIYKKRLVVDVKSTSCKSYDDFLASCDRYEYDQQAAFYLDSIGAKRFVFVAVQKIAPYNIWTAEHHTAGSFVESGRKKYRALLREWKRRNDRGASFIPTSWSTQPHTLCC